MLVAAFPLAAQQPAPTADSAWNTRLAALDEERDAQAGVAVSIVFDDSGSMNDNRKLVMAKQAFHAWLESAPANYRFGLTALNAGPLVKLQPNDKPQVLAAVNHLRAGGGTPLADTIAAVRKEIKKRQAAGFSYERQVVVILTDGEDTSERGIPGVEREIRRLRAENVEVIAFGYQGEGDYLRGSATHFFSPENGEDIARGLSVIGSEIGDTSDVVVDAPTRAAMENVKPPTPGQPSPDDPPAAAATPRPFSPYASPSPSPTPAYHAPRHASQPQGVSGSRIALIAAVFIALRFFRSRRR